VRESFAILRDIYDVPANEHRLRLRFITLSGFLPFQATLSVPLSLYVGRIHMCARRGAADVTATRRLRPDPPDRT
jgi:hypothetical protein